jgi:perosamine synthetase
MERFWPQPSKIRIPVAAPWITDHEKSLINDALDSNWIGSNGLYNVEVENWLSDKLSCSALTVSNGSTALMLALRGVGIQAGDEVLVPELTYAATASSVINVGGVPVFCDVNESDWTLNIESMARMVSPRTRAVIVVHLYGVPANMREIVDFTERHKLQLIEDCAEAFLARVDGKFTGTLGAVGTYSFFANKLITSGEGGAVVTSDESIYQRMKLLRGQGMSEKNRYEFLEPGYNFRLTNIQAALLLGQLERYDEIHSQRQSIEESYRMLLGDLIDNQEVSDNKTRAPWIFTTRLKRMTLDNKFELAHYLAKHGIETRPIFWPMSSMEAFKNFPSDDCRVAASIAENGISLPTGAHILISDVTEIVKLIKELV